MDKNWIFFGVLYLLFEEVSRPAAGVKAACSRGRDNFEDIRVYIRVQWVIQQQVESIIGRLGVRAEDQLVPSSASRGSC